ncbi:MAG: hypothetical protein AAGA67_05535 [Cyanobacteria bacterium P01_F01_bin.153]
MEGIASVSLPSSPQAQSVPVAVGSGVSVERIGIYVTLLLFVVGGFIEMLRRRIDRLESSLDSCSSASERRDSVLGSKIERVVAGEQAWRVKSAANYVTRDELASQMTAMRRDQQQMAQQIEKSLITLSTRFDQFADQVRQDVRALAVDHKRRSQDGD